MAVNLEQIVAGARRTAARPKSQSHLAEMGRRAAHHLPRGFASALRDESKSGPAVIAELKKASPSRGEIRGSFHPSVLALELEQAGAAALSVLTEEEFFQGSLANLMEASVSVDLPCLRKDFIVSDYQVLEARASSADAILLIVAALSDAELRALHESAKQYSLDVLCEVHDADELKRALDLGFEMIGVNNRNLKTLEVNLHTAEDLAAMLPAGVLKVAESGIHTGGDLRRLRACGYDAFLIGESLMRERNVEAATRALLLQEASSA